jgi:ribonucleotide monophosphatase NagD (HAD superfamily)
VAAELFDKFETLLLDLDGVIYEGKNAVVEAVASITAIRLATSLTTPLVSLKPSPINCVVLELNCRKTM